MKDMSRVPMQAGLESAKPGVLSRFGFAQARASGVGRYLFLVLQLGLVLLVINVLKIEEPSGLSKLTPLIFLGFLLHSLLPIRLRPPFFLLLSLAGVYWVFGSVVQATGLIVIALVLFGLCHLPIPFGIRVALLLAAGGGLAVLRIGWISTSWQSLPVLILPIIGSMFMFRLAIYLYDLRHEDRPVSLWQRLSYFFLLPNVCFPLFPVVDYRTFCRSYYDREASEIYQKGVLWIFRGVTHLLAYRVVYHFVLPAPDDVRNLAGVVLTMVATYLLYLRVSGQFHLIVGVLCLFGFNLPETHHRYLLTSSFTDYWRRANIYWKDFMMKLFFYPSFMRLRRFGMVPAVAISTVMVFVITWILHSYQWFWLRGNFPVTVPDILFWAILGVLVTVNVAWETKRGRKRVLKHTHWTFKGSLVHSLKVVGMLLLLCPLWTLWSKGTVREFVALLNTGAAGSTRDYALLLLGVATFVLIGVGVQYLRSVKWDKTPFGFQPGWGRSYASVTLPSLMLIVIGWSWTPAPPAKMSEVLAVVRADRLNKEDEALLQKGYYEGLLVGDKYLSALWSIQAGKPSDWKATLVDLGLAQRTNDMLLIELAPSRKGKYKGATVRTNRWGMRDREYQKEKPQHTYRIALLGSSHVMGYGVEDDQVFESIVENQLNLNSSRVSGLHYELLNFGTSGYSLLSQLFLIEERVFAFNPDTVFYFSNYNEESWVVDRLVQIMKQRITIPYSFLSEMIQRSGATPEMPETELKERLKSFGYDIVSRGYKEIVYRCRSHGILPVWLYLPEPGEVNQNQKIDRLVHLARDAHFWIFDLEDVYQGRDPREIRLAPWDEHPNAYAHKLIAKRLLGVLMENRQLLERPAQTGRLREQ